jgi:Cu2+-containing amine oxidase
MYYKERPEDNTYARPVEGVRVVVDLLKQCVVLVVVVFCRCGCGCPY